MLGNATATVVLVGSSAGGIGAFNAATWLLESFDQVCILTLHARPERQRGGGGGKSWWYHISMQRTFNNNSSDAQQTRGLRPVCRSSWVSNRCREKPSFPRVAGLALYPAGVHTHSAWMLQPDVQVLHPIPHFCYSNKIESMLPLLLSATRLLE